MSRSNSNNKNSNKNIELSQKTKFKKVIETLRVLGLISTFHGIPCVLRTNKLFLKLMWLILFLISTSFGVYFSYSAVIVYLNYEVNFKVNLIKEIPTQFPTVSFNFNDYFSDKNYTLDQRLISCTFNKKRCNYTDFEDLRIEEVDLRYFKFNSGKDYYGNKKDLKNSILVGSDNGLSIQLFIGLPDSFSNINGFPVYIHNSSFDPLIKAKYPIFVSPGTASNLKVEKQFISKLGEPYNQCKTNLLYPDDYDSIIYKHMVSLNSSNKYNQNDCYDLCQAKYMIDNCNTSLNLNYISILDNIIHSDLDKECLTNKKQEFFNQNVYDYCLKFCPLECETVKYDVSLTFSQHPTKRFASQLVKSEKIKSFYPKGYNITLDDLRQSVIFLNIFYDDLSYTIITQDAKMLLVDLVSNIGGLLGLFIGISFLSFGELFEIFFEIVFIMFDSHSKNIKKINISTKS